jgi:thioredoxin 1
MQRTQVTVVAAVIAAVVAFLVARDYVARPAAAPRAEGLPRLLEVGATGCDACDHMAPIIAALAAELRGKVDVRVVNVTEEPAAINRYRLQTIPVQIFEDAQGRELWRNTGRMEREEILGKLRELGMLESGG